VCDALHLPALPLFHELFRFLILQPDRHEFRELERTKFFPFRQSVKICEIRVKNFFVFIRVIHG